MQKRRERRGKVFVEFGGRTVAAKGVLWRRKEGVEGMHRGEQHFKWSRIAGVEE